MNVVWTSYLRFRANARGYDLEALEQILRHTDERYQDTRTGRFVAVGRHGSQLVLIPYEVSQESIVPVTVHAISRQQIRFRLRTGRFVYV